MKRKKIAKAGLCIALLLLMGCADHREETDASRNSGSETVGANSVDIRDRDVLVAEVGATFDSLNPIKASTQAARTLAVNCFEGLMKLDETGQLVQGQAESYEVSEDGLTYTFTLREDIRWSDGSAVTAQDFVYAWQQLIGSDNGSKIQMVENAGEILAGKQQESKLGIQAVDERTLEISLSYADPFFLDVCADPACVPLKENFAVDEMNSWSKEAFVCNGAYVIDELLDSGVALEKNASYYNEAAVAEKPLQLLWNQQQALEQLQQGELFFAESVSEENVSEQAVWTLEFSLREKLLGIYVDDLHAKGESEACQTVREALGLAVDRVYIAYEMGEEWSNLEGLLSSLDQAQELTWNTGDFEADCDQAEAAFYEAGIDPGTVHMYLYENWQQPLMTELIASMWEQELNVTVKTQQKQQKGANYEGYAFVCEKTAESSNPQNLGKLQTQESGFYLPEEIEDADVTAINEVLRESSVLIPICYAQDCYGVNQQVEKVYSQNGCRYFMYLSLS